MAYMNQEKKAQIAALIKPLLKEYGLKGSLSVKNYSSIMLTLKEGPINFINNKDKDYQQVNVYWIADNYTGIAKEFLLKAVKALQGANYYDNTNSMIDYFDTAYYYGITVGNWEKPYKLVTN